MKLVQLLAKELKEWPEGAKYARQDFDGEICFVGVGIWSDFYAPCVASDIYLEDGIGASQITEDQWQVEREKMNKPKWIRARGKKPNYETEYPQRMHVRHRDGSTTSGWTSQAFNWSYLDGAPDADIMAYCVLPMETKEQEINQVKDTNLGTLTYKLEIDATEATQRIDSLVAKWSQIVSPLKWRDAIIHCQAIIEDCEREIQRNVNLLDAEGLMMQKDSKKAMQHYAPDVDMSDWRNWQAGDVIEIVANEGGHQFENGEEVIVVLLDLNDIDMSVKAEYKDGSDYWWISGKDAKFMRRP